MTPERLVWIASALLVALAALLFFSGCAEVFLAFNAATTLMSLIASATQDTLTEAERAQAAKALQAHLARWEARPEATP